MTKVKQLLELGLSIAAAIKQALELAGFATLAAFADKYDIPRPTVSNAINGAVRPTDAIIAALIAELGGTEPEWRELLWQAGKPDSVSAA